MQAFLPFPQWQKKDKHGVLIVFIIMISTSTFHIHDLRVLMEKYSQVQNYMILLTPQPNNIKFKK